MRQLVWGNAASMRSAGCLVALLAAALLGAAACGGSDSPEALLEVAVSPAGFDCEAEQTTQTSRTCTPVEAVALVRCSPDRVSYELPAGMRHPDVDAGDVCGELSDDDLLSPEAEESCAQPLGRVSVAGEVDREPVQLVLRKCTEEGTPADEWARLVRLPFAKVPNR